ncbi:MAG TPA: hypothetical protein PKX87_07175, partial [Alphaproteobacteria bacterium]|nr:hypothetical protein [Alphaproteobacteria bacterium]
MKDTDDFIPGTFLCIVRSAGGAHKTRQPETGVSRMKSIRFLVLSLALMPLGMGFPSAAQES